jgi:hypothetical protein
MLYAGNPGGGPWYDGRRDVVSTSAPLQLHWSNLQSSRERDRYRSRFSRNSLFLSGRLVSSNRVSVRKGRSALFNFGSALFKTGNKVSSSHFRCASPCRAMQGNTARSP